MIKGTRLCCPQCGHLWTRHIPGPFSAKSCAAHTPGMGNGYCQCAADLVQPKFLYPRNDPFTTLR